MTKVMLSLAAVTAGPNVIRLSNSDYRVRGGITESRLMAVKFDSIKMEMLSQLPTT